MQVPLHFLGSHCTRQRSAALDDVDGLVVCGDAMYLFGGVDTLENGQKEPSNDLYMFVPKREQGSLQRQANPSKGDISSIICTKVEAGAAPGSFHY